MTDFLRKGRIRGAFIGSQGIESLELKDFEAQWRWLIRGSIILFLFGSGRLFHEGYHIIYIF